jgi:hypothetical protein
MVQAPGADGGGGSGTPQDPNSYPVATWRVTTDPSETNGLNLPGQPTGGPPPGTRSRGP